MGVKTLSDLRHPWLTFAGLRQNRLSTAGAICAAVMTSLILLVSVGSYFYSQGDEQSQTTMSRIDASATLNLRQQVDSNRQERASRCQTRQPILRQFAAEVLHS